MPSDATVVAAVAAVTAVAAVADVAAVAAVAAAVAAVAAVAAAVAVCCNAVVAHELAAETVVDDTEAFHLHETVVATAAVDVVVVEIAASFLVAADSIEIA